MEVSTSSNAALSNLLNRCLEDVPSLEANFIIDAGEAFETGESVSAVCRDDAIEITEK